MNRKLLLLSSSKVYGCNYLEFAADTLREYFKSSNVTKLLFIPYASKKYDEYLQKVKNAFADLKLEADVRGIHEGSDPIFEIHSAQAIFIGGGNTFLLLKTLYDLKLIDPIRKRVLQDGIPYIGSSAGTNVATISVNTTNDMPIVYPPSFSALALVPFNINPHYVDAVIGSKHMGETREERILEYLQEDECHPVLGLREGSSLLVEGNNAKLLGSIPAILFKKGPIIEHIQPGSDLSYLL